MRKRISYYYSKETGKYYLTGSAWVATNALFFLIEDDDADHRDGFTATSGAIEDYVSFDTPQDALLSYFIKES